MSLTSPAPDEVPPEDETAPDEELPPGLARRTDGQVVNVLATIGGRSRRPSDPEGMGGDSWRRFP